MRNLARTPWSATPDLGFVFLFNGVVWEFVTATILCGGSTWGTLCEIIFSSLVEATWGRVFAEDFIHMNGRSTCQNFKAYKQWIDAKTVFLFNGSSNDIHYVFQAFSTKYFSDDETFWKLWRLVSAFDSHLMVFSFLVMAFLVEQCNRWRGIIINRLLTRRWWLWSPWHLIRIRYGKFDGFAKTIEVWVRDVWWK